MEIAYIVITLVATGVLVFMLLAGMDHDVEMDVDADLDIDVDVDADIDAGGGPAVMSLKLLLLFLVGFGIVGYFALTNNWNPLGSGVDHLLFATGGGAVSYFILYRLIKLLHSQQASSQTNAALLTGRKASTTTAIADGHVGEIIARDPKTGQTVYLRAQAQDPATKYEKGQDVEIVSVANGMAIVK